MGYAKMIGAKRRIFGVKFSRFFDFLSLPTILA
jgi:hypothetical protein